MSTDTIQEGNALAAAVHNSIGVRAMQQVFVINAFAANR